MDAGIAAAARALEHGDVLAALGYVSLRNDAHALAMRGVVMAQLGELDVARGLLRRASRMFARQRDPRSVARCAVAHAEIEIAERRFGDGAALDRAAKSLAAKGDARNASWAFIVAARGAIAIGDLDRARGSLAAATFTESPVLLAVRALAEYEIALRSLDAEGARDAVRRAAASRAGSNALAREIDEATSALERPVARIAGHGEATLADVQRAHRSIGIVVDACQRIVRRGDTVVDLRRRPIPFALLRVLAASWPSPAPRAVLALRAFEAKRLNESHRARLRVEIGRLRTLARVAIVASEEGFRLDEKTVTLIEPLDDSLGNAVIALLARGEAWPVRSLAAALQVSPRTVQRTLVQLEAETRVRAHGRGAATRWALASPIASQLLLPGLLTVR